MTENCVLLILKETNTAFMRCHVAFFRGFRLAHTFGGADAALSPSLWEIFDASLHQDRATMSGSFCSRCTGILTANKRVTVCSFVTSSCCAINWFRCKQKRKWSRSRMLLTQATHLISEKVFPREGLSHCTISTLIPTRLKFPKHSL